nr:MAG TPA: hypothetical protein [Caudoviricetes sp.]
MPKHNGGFALTRSPVEIRSGCKQDTRIPRIVDSR